jgi:carboxymethylenebutenolidase
MSEDSGLQRDFDSLVGLGRASHGAGRRGFVKLALGSGFAAAVLPVLAQSVIKTDSVGLTAGEVMLTIDGQQVPVYRAQPAGRRDLPVVLVVSEIFGVHEHIADVARRFAKLGYLALAPDLFVRQGDPGSYGTVAEVISQVIAKVPDAQVMKDLDACVAYAAANGGDTERLGITGFCWGGRITWLYAAYNPKVRAGAAWYGRMVGEHNALTPQQPVDVAAQIKGGVLGLYGGRDDGIPSETIRQMQAALDRGSSKSEFIVYPNSGHAFHADYRASYVAADARDGFSRTLAWFRSHGVV